MKLGIMSGISILMVAAMIGIQMVSNASIRHANEAAIRQRQLPQSAAMPRLRSAA